MDTAQPTGRNARVSKYQFDPPRWDSAKNELILAKIPIDHDFEINYEMALFITFDEIEFIEGEEVLTVMNKFVDVVEGIVMTIKAECKRIGLFCS